MPLELLIEVLSPLDKAVLIKFRAVSKKWRLVIDQYLLQEFDLFYNEPFRRHIFLKYNRTHSKPKNAIPYYTMPGWDRRIFDAMSLEKIKFLFRNARKLNLFTAMYEPATMDEFISKYYLLSSF